MGRSSDTIDLVCYDFDDDGDSDCVTINMDGIVEFYENYQANGFREIGTPVRVLNFTNKELDRDLELNYFVAAKGDNFFFLPWDGLVNRTLFSLTCIYGLF